MFIVCDGSDCPYVVETREEAENSIKESLSVYVEWVKDTINQERFKYLVDFKVFESGDLPPGDHCLEVFEVTQAEINGFNEYMEEQCENVHVSLSVESINNQGVLWMKDSCCWGLVPWLEKNSVCTHVHMIQRIHDEMPDLYKQALEAYIGWREA